MKVPRHMVKRAALKRMRTKGGLGEGEQAPAPKRPSAPEPSARSSSSPEIRGPPAAPEIDLTAETLPGGAAETEHQGSAAGMSAGESISEPTEPGPVEEGAPETADPTPTGGEAPARAEPAEPAQDAGGRDWGEGPSGAGGSPSAEASPETLARPTPAPEEGTEGGRGRTRPRRALLMDNGRLAERIISQTILPEFQEELRVMGASAFYREAYVSILRSANFLAATREVLKEGETLVLQARGEAEEAGRKASIEAARARAALDQFTMAEDALLARDLRIGELETLLRSAEAQAEQERARAQQAEATVRAAEAAAEIEITAARAEAEAKVAAASAGAEAWVAAVRAETEANVAVVRAGAEARAAAAEAKAEARAAAAEAKAAAAEAESEARVAAAEAGAEAKATAAVEAFKISKQFAEELAEATADSYLQGFREGREKVARDLNFPQALEVMPESDTEPVDEEDTAADTAAGL